MIILNKVKTNSRGFSILETILAAGFFMILAISVGTAIIQSLNNNRLASDQSVAINYAKYGLEAVRSIRNQAFSNLVNTSGSGLSASQQGQWQLNGTSSTFDKHTMAIVISDVYRDYSGNIVSSGGTLDGNTKKVTANVNWNWLGDFSRSVSLSTYLTAWRGSSGGMLVYGDGGTTSDAVKYKMFNGQIWSDVSSTADVDTLSSNKYLRAARVYASETRNEKMMISRHYNGSSQFIYAQVYNGSSWGNVVSLSSFAVKTFLDVQNFDGTYLSNGDFVAIYSDNTNVPKMRVWNGSAWGAAVSLPSISDVPNYIVAKNRPNTNEIMGAFFDQSKDANTTYFNGGAYVTSNWSAAVLHADNATNATQRLMDFVWSQSNLLVGALVYSNKATDKTIEIKIFIADGSGSGSWGSEVSGPTQSKNILVLKVAAASNFDRFLVCDKDANNPPRIICYSVDFSATWSSPTNNTLITGTEGGLQRSFDLAFERIAGDPALFLYSNNSAIPQLKKYSVSSNSFDVSAVALSTLVGTVKSVRSIQQPQGDDVIFLIGDSALDLYSVIWDGKSGAIYVTPVARAFNTHGTNGSVATDFWYDFVWDAN